MSTNEAAERLRRAMRLAGMQDFLSVLDIVLAAERRATVERIRERLNTDHGLSGSGVFAINEADLDAILDEVADAPGEAAR